MPLKFVEFHLNFIDNIGKPCLYLTVKNTYLFLQNIFQEHSSGSANKKCTFFSISSFYKTTNPNSGENSMKSFRLCYIVSKKKLVFFLGWIIGIFLSFKLF